MSPPEPAVELRAIETAPSAFQLDTEGSTAGWGPALDTRLRAGIALAAGQARAALEADVLAGQLLGATWALPSLDERGRDRNDALTAAGLAAREASVGVRLPWFDVELGLQTSRWGLGMLANDGAADPLFGRTDFGDRALRARIATQPLANTRAATPLYLVLAGDRVVADELARMADGDVAWQGVAAALYRAPSPVEGMATELGVYGVLRDQRTREAEGQRATRARVIDAAAAVPIVAEPLVFVLEAEGAAITGETDASRTYAAPGGVRIASQGLALRASARPIVRESWRAELRLALASGDSTPDDGRVTDFRFDRDYDVGFVLFDEVLSAYDLAAMRQARDPTLAAVPPEGLDTLAAEGAFHQAAAVQPALGVAVAPWVGVRLGAVFAWSTGPIAQPYTTFRSGGVPTNALGQPTEDRRYLGTEIDWAVASRELPIAHWTVRPSIDLQVGHAWPSRALAGPTGRIDHLLVVARARY